MCTPKQKPNLPVNQVNNTLEQNTQERTDFSFNVEGFRKESEVIVNKNYDELIAERILSAMNAESAKEEAQKNIYDLCHIKYKKYMVSGVEKMEVNASVDNNTENCFESNTKDIILGTKEVFLGDHGEIIKERTSGEEGQIFLGSDEYFSIINEDMNGKIDALLSIRDRVNEKGSLIREIIMRDVHRAYMYNKDNFKKKLDYKHVERIRNKVPKGNVMVFYKKDQENKKYNYDYYDFQRELHELIDESTLIEAINVKINAFKNNIKNGTGSKALIKIMKELDDKSKPQELNWVIEIRKKIRDSRADELRDPDIFVYLMDRINWLINENDINEKIDAEIAGLLENKVNEATLQIDGQDISEEELLVTDKYFEAVKSKANDLVGWFKGDDEINQLQIQLILKDVHNLAMSVRKEGSETTIKKLELTLAENLIGKIYPLIDNADRLEIKYLERELSEIIEYPETLQDMIDSLRIPLIYNSNGSEQEISEYPKTLQDTIEDSMRYNARYKLCDLDQLSSNIYGFDGAYNLKFESTNTGCIEVVYKIDGSLVSLHGNIFDQANAGKVSFKLKSNDTNYRRWGKNPNPDIYNWVLMGNHPITYNIPNNIDRLLEVSEMRERYINIQTEIDNILNGVENRKNLSERAKYFFNCESGRKAFKQCKRTDTDLPCLLDIKPWPLLQSIYYTHPRDDVVKDKWNDRAHMDVKGLILHSVAGVIRSAELFNMFNVEDERNTHGSIEDDGTIVQMLPWNHKAGHCSNEVGASETNSLGSTMEAYSRARSVNHTYIGIEMFEPKREDGLYRDGNQYPVGNIELKARQYMRKTYNLAVDLFANLCVQYKIDPLGKHPVIAIKRIPNEDNKEYIENVEEEVIILVNKNTPDAPGHVLRKEVVDNKTTYKRLVKLGWENFTEVNVIQKPGEDGIWINEKDSTIEYIAKPLWVHNIMSHSEAHKWHVGGDHQDVEFLWDPYNVSKNKKDAKGNSQLDADEEDLTMDNFRSDVWKAMGSPKLEQEDLAP